MKRIAVVVVGIVILASLPGAGLAPADGPASVGRATTPPAELTPDGPASTAGEPDFECTFGRATAPDETIAQPRVTGKASLVSVDTGDSYRDDTVVRYRLTFVRPAGVEDLAVQSRVAEVTGTAAFDRSGSWFVARNETASITVRIDPRFGQFGWAFARPPVVVYRWTSGGETHCTRTTAERSQMTMTASPGMNVTHAQQGVLLSPGRHAVRTFTVDGTTIRIVFDADRSGPTFDPARAEAELTAVARHLDVESSTERVTVFALPASAAGPAVAFPAGADPTTRTVTVGTMRSVDAGAEVWTHEYVHAVQTFRTGERMDWFVEGSAEYFTHLLQARLDRSNTRTGHEKAKQLVHTVRYARESVLTEPDTWRGNTEYRQGAVALLVLDNRLREASNGRYTVIDVFEWMNTHDGRVTYDAFRDRLVRWGDESVGRWLDAHVDGRAAYRADGIELPDTGRVTRPDRSRPGVQRPGHRVAPNRPELAGDAVAIAVEPDTGGGRIAGEVSTDTRNGPSNAGPVRDGLATGNASGDSRTDNPIHTVTARPRPGVPLEADVRDRRVRHSPPPTP